MEQQNTSTQQNAKTGSGKSRRGFASMDKERHKLVSSRGGKSERTKQLSDRELRQTPTGYEVR